MVLSTTSMASLVSPFRLIRNYEKYLANVKIVTFIYKFRDEKIVSKQYKCNI
jgi:hypothetical protein